ncbi:jg14095 [Pararge aegeria aegeria]|uniref:Jg14095 protein n=1 Tax=Pararge aegeria aegeria TaxID=348720 RepID=A0A8S4QWQ4_9NEOP|nr:jg14095 [Pararge aegeria aegeria]
MTALFTHRGRFSWVAAHFYVTQLADLLRDFFKRLSCTVQARIFSFFGHVSRRNNVSIERLVVQRRVEGTRARGRSPMRCTDQLKATIEAPLHECARKATVREGLSSEPQHSGDDHDQSVKTVTTKKKTV